MPTNNKINSERKYYLTTKSFVQYSGIAQRTLWRMIKRNEVKPVKKDRRLLFHFSELPSEKIREKFLLDIGLINKKDTTKEDRRFDNLKPWEKAAIGKRKSILKAYLSATEGVPWGKTEAIKRHFGKLNGVSFRTLDRLADRYKKHGDYGLIPDWNPGNQKKLIDRKISKFIENTFLVPNGPQVKETYERLIVEFANKRERLPSYRTVHRFIKDRWTESQQLLIRNKQEWDRKYSPHVRRDWNKVKINEVWFGDAKQIDVACLFRGKPVFPWFTSFLDGRSRKFTGWILTPSHDSMSIAQAYCYGVSRHGAPKTVYIDRGRSYRSQLIAGTKLKKGKDGKLFDKIDETAIPGVFRELGTEIFYAAPYNAREKIIEPNFKCFTYRHTGLPGYRAHNNRLRPKKLANEIKAGKLLSFEELSFKIDQIINDRNNRPHSTTGKSPSSFYENFVPIIPTKDFLAYLSHDVNVKKVRDSSVSVDRMLYRHDELWRLAGEKVEVRRDPKDLRQAAIIYKDDLFCFATLETTAHYRSPLTLESVKTCRRIRNKARKWRKQVIESENYIEDPLRMAVELEEEESVRARDIRPATSKMTSLNKRERVAKDIASGLNSIEVNEEAEEKAVARGEGVLTILAQAAAKDSQRERERPKYKSFHQLSLHDRLRPIEED